MNGKEKTVEIKELTKTVKDKEDKVEYEIQIAKQSVVLKKWEAGQEVEVKVKYKKKADAEWSDEKTVSAKLEDGFYSDNFKLNTKIDATLELKEAISVSPAGITSINLKFWVLIFFLVVIVVGGGIWWWLSSSKSEDKEEEGL